MKYTYIIILCLLSQLLWAQDNGNILIKNGTVITITNGNQENTDVLISNGKIRQIGNNISAPSGTKVIDATGQYVMPGIVDAHSHVGIDAVNEATNPVTAEVFTGDAINPFSIGIYRALAGGVTVSHAMHGSANVIGGQCETIKHRFGTWDPDEFKMKDAPRTIKFALGENPMRVHGERSKIQPATRMGVEQVFRRAFSEAKLYMEAWKEHQTKSRSKSYKGLAPTYNERMEVLSDILRGDIIVHCHSYRADEIIMLLNVLEDFGVDKIVFQHVNEGFKVAPELAEYGAGASVFADWWAYKFEVYYSTAYNATILSRNGVLTSINSDSRELIRHLYHEAAKTQRYGGLEDIEALKMITINPAKQLGIDHRVGSIEVGKDGDIAIFSEHPLSVYTVPQMTIVDGVVRFDIENDPDDMRIDVDPEETIPTFFDHQNFEESEQCMEGVSEQLFEFNSTHKH